MTAKTTKTSKGGTEQLTHIELATRATEVMACDGMGAGYRATRKTVGAVDVVAISAWGQEGVWRACATFERQGATARWLCVDPHPAEQRQTAPAWCLTFPTFAALFEGEPAGR